MADCINSNSNDGLKQLLQPFYHRASDAEDRLSRLEAVFSSNKGVAAPGNEEYSKKAKELELKLEEVTAALAAEKEKVAKLTGENVKKGYRILHLVKAINEADLKLEKLPAN